MFLLYKAKVLRLEAKLSLAKIALFKYGKENNTFSFLFFLLKFTAISFFYPHLKMNQNQYI